MKKKILTLFKRSQINNKSGFGKRNLTYRRQKIYDFRELYPLII